MALFNTINGIRIQLDDGSEVDVSVLWDLHIMVPDYGDQVFIRLSDAHADEKVAILYTQAIEAGQGFELSLKAPQVQGQWTPLADAHFQVGMSADCLRLSQHRITDRRGLVTILGMLLRKMGSEKYIPMPVMARDAQERIHAHVPGLSRSTLPVRTIDGAAANQTAAGTMPGGMKNMQSGLNSLAQQLHAAAANPGGMPGSMAAGVQQMSQALKGKFPPQGSGSNPGSAPAPSGPQAPAPTSAPPASGGRRRQKPGAAPVTQPFKSGSRPFGGKLKSWF